MEISYESFVNLRGVPSWMFSKDDIKQRHMTGKYKFKRTFFGNLKVYVQIIEDGCLKWRRASMEEIHGLGITTFIFE